MDIKYCNCNCNFLGQINKFTRGRMAHPSVSIKSGVHHLGTPRGTIRCPDSESRPEVFLALRVDGNPSRFQVFFNGVVEAKPRTPATTETTLRHKHQHLVQYLVLTPKDMPSPSQSLLCQLLGWTTNTSTSLRFHIREVVVMWKKQYSLHKA